MRRPHFERRTRLGDKRNLVKDFEETKAKNYVAAESQRQFNRQTVITEVA
jgi:hypothetical protein